MGISTVDTGNQIGMLTRLGSYSPIGAHTVLTNGAVATVLTKPSRATGILIQSVGYASLFTLDGTDPTLTLGFFMPKDQWPIYIPLNDENILTVARAEGTDASLRYQWVREED